jgi:phosphoribosylanthranilate isomerase
MTGLKTKIKICGINSEAAFDAVLAEATDYLGFVFFERSPRFVTPARAAALSALHTGGPLRTALFVEPQQAEIAATSRIFRPDILQIYGSAELCRQIRSEFELPVWRAIGVATQADLPADSEGIDGFVIEAKPPKGATRPGGNATAMDWALLAGWTAPAPWFLGGGLNPSNVAQAIAQTNAPGVDVSSGVESTPGQKSPQLIHDFVTEVRRASAGTTR